MTALVLALSGCAIPSAGPDVAGAGSSLSGHVSFPLARHAQATTAEIATAATISLIDPQSNTTVATTLTRPDRSFELDTSRINPQVKTYYLEAVKGLKSNLAGFDAARLRTLVRWTGNGWAALTPNDASIGYSTTALAAIVSLRSVYTPVNADTLIGKLDLGPPIVFDSTGTGVTQGEFGTVSGIVVQSLLNDRDPLEALTYNGSEYKPKTAPGAGPPPFVSSVAPVPLAPGQGFFINGGNFAPDAADNLVDLGGVPVVLSAGSPQTLAGTVPASARTGVLRVVTASGTASFNVTVVPGIGGGLNTPGAAPPASGTGTTIDGSVFGRLGSPFFGVPSTKDTR